MASSLDAPINGIISTSWLAENLSDPAILIIDLRPASDYITSHIPNAINIPFSVPECTWISYGPDELLLELPTNDSEFFSHLSNAGVAKEKRIVITSATATPPYPQADTARVAWTLTLAGFEKVHILDGGTTLWESEGREMSTRTTPEIAPSGVKGSLDRSTVVNREYVRSAISEKKIIIDARDLDVFNGKILEEWAKQPGHIESARNLPTINLFDENGKYKDKESLKRMVESVIGSGTEKNIEIIVHCGVGGYAGVIYWVLEKVLGYTNVKFYDGAAQDWVRHYGFVV